MEENKNEQNNAELTDEQLDQASGGIFYIVMGGLVCSRCGKSWDSTKTICECGNALKK